MRLIDADAATFPTPHRKEVNAYMRGWNRCLSSVLQQPAIDAVPVVHGYWIMTEFVSEDTGIWWSWHCSNCGDTYDGLGKLDERKHKYCHHCGAIMDGGEKNAG